MDCNNAKSSLNCSCGCGGKGVHTQGDKDLLEFLKTEIDGEKRMHKDRGFQLGSTVDGFEIATDEAVMTLTKKFNDETIKITLNVNHSVDADVTEDQAKQEESPELKSKPTFDIDIVKGGSKTLSFTCSFAQQESGPEEEFSDLFQIEEVTIFDKECEEKTYVVSGDILDGNLYDLLMNLLEERGISNAFVDKLCNTCTTYEHKLYIGLLEGLQHFVAGK